MSDWMLLYDSLFGNPRNKLQLINTVEFFKRRKHCGSKLTLVDVVNFNPPINLINRKLQVRRFVPSSINLADNNTRPLFNSDVKLRHFLNPRLNRDSTRLQLLLLLLLPPEMMIPNIALSIWPEDNAISTLSRPADLLRRLSLRCMKSPINNAVTLRGKSNRRDSPNLLPSSNN